jgi:signal transduction histidine kinase
VDNTATPSSSATQELFNGPAPEGPFLAELCHHVRTPLNGILGSLELLLDADLTDDVRELAATAFQSAIDLHHLFESDLAAVQHPVS